MGVAVGARDDLLERERELAELAALVTDAATGRGGMVAVVGPAGIGKTRLLAALRANAAELAGADGRAITVASAAGTSLETDIAFAAVRQLFEPLLRTSADPAALFEGGAAPAAAVLGYAGAAAEPDVAPGTVLHGLYWLVVALAERAAPIVLACDDLHWYDAASLRFLAYLVHRIGELPVAIVAATRHADPASAEGEILARLLELPAVRRLRPAPLSRDAVRELVHRSRRGSATRAFCDAVAEASGGNPFLVGEVLRAARADERAPLDTAALAALNPDASLVSRIACLSPTSADVAKAVAVLGKDAHLRHVAALAGLDIDEAGHVADQLLRADVLAADRPLAFVHPLVGGAVYSSMLPGERSATHRRAVALLRAEDVAAERLAPHLMVIEPAGDEETVATLEAAATAAMRRGATEVAIGQLRRALAEPVSPGRRLGIVLRLAVAESFVNDRAAIERFEEAIAAIPDRAVQLQLATAQGATYALNGRWPEAAAALRRFDGDGELRVRRLGGLAVAAAVGRVPAAELAAALGALRDAVPLDADRASVPAEALAMRAYAGAMAGDDAELVASVLAGLVESVRLGDEMLPMWLQPALGALAMVDRDRLAASVIEDALTAARRAGAPAQVGVMLFQRSVISFRAGDLDDAAADATASLELCADYRLDFLAAAPLSVLVDVLRERDELTAAEELLAEHGYGGTADLADEQAISAFDLLLLFARARLRGAELRWDESLSDLRVGWELAASCGCPSPGFIAWQANLAYAQVLSGVPRDAADLSRSALAEAVAFGALRPIAEAQRAVVMAGAAGDEGVELLDLASKAFGDLGAKLEETRTIAARALAAGATGEGGDVDELSRAQWLAEQVGANHLAAQCRARLRQLGVARGRYRPQRGLAALTASERRVATLAAAGRSNKDVAQELYVTVKTVETHLAKAFRKLGVTSRAALPEALAGG